MEENFEFYSEKLYELRKAKGMSQEEFAEKVGVSRQSIYAWESGKSLPDIENLYKMCKILETDLDQLTNLKSLSKEKYEEPKKLNYRKIMKYVGIILISIVVIYILIVIKHFNNVIHLKNKIQSIGEYENYSYSYANIKYNDDTEIDNCSINYVYYKDGILKVYIDNDNIQWFDFNNKLHYNFNEKEKTVSKNELSAEDIEIIKLPYKISSFSSNGLISKNNGINLIASLSFPFSYRIQSNKESYVLKHKDKNTNYIEFINKETGFTIEKQRVKKDGQKIFEKYQDIKINETTDEDVKMPNIEEYTIIL